MAEPAMGAVLQGLLTASVADGASGPVIMLSGEADLNSAEELSALMTAQVSRGTRQLTVDVSGLQFADSATVQALVMAACALKQRGATMVLLRPQPAVARVLTLTGADRLFTSQEQTPAPVSASCSAGSAHPPTASTARAAARKRQAAQ